MNQSKSLLLVKIFLTTIFTLGAQLTYNYSSNKIILSSSILLSQTPPSPLPPGNPCNVNMGRSPREISDGEMKRTERTISNLEVKAGFTVTVEGYILVVGSQYSIGSRIVVEVTDFECKKCIFGFACGGCNMKDDHRMYAPCNQSSNPPV